MLYPRSELDDCLASSFWTLQVSARLGHATVAFTLDVYTKVVPQLDRDAAGKIAELIFGNGDADVQD